MYQLQVCVFIFINTCYFIQANTLSKLGKYGILIFSSFNFVVQHKQRFQYFFFNMNKSLKTNNSAEVRINKYCYVMKRINV